MEIMPSPGYTIENIKADIEDPEFIISETVVYTTLRWLIAEVETLQKERQGWQDLFAANSKKLLDENEKLNADNERLRHILDDIAAEDDE